MLIARFQGHRTSSVLIIILLFIYKLYDCIDELQDVLCFLNVVRVIYYLVYTPYLSKMVGQAKTFSTKFQKEETTTIAVINVDSDEDQASLMLF